MREHLATLLEDFRRYDRLIAVVRYQGNRRRATSYGELARLAGRFAALLERRGIGLGDRVLIWGENSAEWTAAFHGCILRGVLAVPLDAYGSADFARRVAADVRPKLAVGDTLLLKQLSHPSDKNKNVAREGQPEFEIPALAFEDWPGALPAEEAGPVVELGRETPLQILFTSGTTGEPKGVVLTHGNVLASVEPIERGAQPFMRWERLLAHPLRILETLPLSHVFGQTMGLWIPPIFAAEAHFESRLVAARLIETIRRERISVLAAVPRVTGLLKTHLEAEHPGLNDWIAGSKGIRAWQRWWRFRKIHRELGLKFWALISGGGALPGQLEKFWNGLGFVVVQGYGMTESSALITLNHPFHTASGSIGKPLPGREVKLGPDGEVLVRGAMISSATWSGGALQPRAGEWLATGDLAESAAGGELRFLGRKSEVIVTSAGMNLYPEDLEAAVEQEPNVAACAVVAIESAAGPEPCAVLAMRGAGEGAAAAIERANGRLAEFQQLRRWVLWPEPDLPRTSSGKVRRKAVSEWLAGIQDPTKNGAAAAAGAEGFGAASDWLLKLIAEITGEAPHGVGDEQRLSEDLFLDSLGRVQLAAALEERLGIALENGALEEARTLGEVRSLVGGAGDGRAENGLTEAELPVAPSSGAEGALDSRGIHSDIEAPAVSREKSLSVADVAGSEEDVSIYPRWPWIVPIQWLRAAFIEAVERPLVWLLGAPRVVAPELPADSDPLLIVANHVTAYDGPLIQYALPGLMRRRMAVAMAGEMLAEYRSFRNPEQPSGRRGIYLPGPAIWLLLTLLFNVFPLPRRRNFQHSFAHAGAALDHGYNVLVFPEGTRSAQGALGRFRGGIGLLVKQSGAAVLPLGLRGLGELKAARRGWFRSGRIEVHVGQPIRFAPEESEASITERLHAEVERLLGA